MCIGVAPPPKAPWPHPIIAREGWMFVMFFLLAALVSAWLVDWFSALLLVLIAILCLLIFRDPPRYAPIGKGLVLSPADGRVVAVEEADDPWLMRRALKISVFMNLFNVYSNRSPVDGDIKELWNHPGNNAGATPPDKVDAKNSARNVLWFQTKASHDVTFVQIAGLLTHNILCYVRPGMWLSRGQRLGFIRFGSRVDVYLPLHSKPRVALGDKVRASSDVLAQL